MVGAKGFEPSTSWSRTRRASQAALRPDSKAVRGQENTRRDTKNSTGYEGPPANLFRPGNCVPWLETRQNTLPCKQNRRRGDPLRREKVKLEARLERVAQCEFHDARPVQRVGVVPKAAGNVNFRKGAENVESDGVCQIESLRRE